MLQKGTKYREATKDQAQEQKAKNSHLDAAVHGDNINQTIQSHSAVLCGVQPVGKKPSVLQYSV